MGPARKRSEQPEAVSNRQERPKATRTRHRTITRSSSKRPCTPRPDKTDKKSHHHAAGQVLRVASLPGFPAGGTMPAGVRPTLTSGGDCPSGGSKRPKV